MKLPPAIDDRTAAAMMLKGMTAEFLLLRIARVGRGDTILFHAAAGGVGSIACQWAKSLGLRVIGTAGGADKVARARALGCDDVIDYDTRGHRGAGQGAHGRRRRAVGVRRRRQGTFDASLACLAMRGMLVLFGQSSGVGAALRSRRAGEGVAVSDASRRWGTTSRRAKSWCSRRASCSRSSPAAPSRSTSAQTYPLADAARAHRDLEARRTTGSTLLIPAIEPPARFR